MIKIGDTVVWRGAWGTQPPKMAKITEMQVTEEPRCKYGRVVIEVDKSLVRENRVVFVLDNGHFCYSDQIDLDMTARLPDYRERMKLEC